MSKWTCPVDGCEFEGDSVSNVRAHINAMGDSEHRWKELKSEVVRADDPEGGSEDQPKARDGEGSEDPTGTGDESDPSKQEAGDSGGSDDPDPPTDIDNEYAAQYGTSGQEGADDQPKAGDGKGSDEPEDGSQEPAEAAGWSAGTALVLATVALLVVVLIRGSDDPDDQGAAEPELSDDTDSFGAWSE